MWDVLGFITAAAFILTIASAVVMVFISMF